MGVIGNIGKVNDLQISGNGALLADFLSVIIDKRVSLFRSYFHIDRKLEHLGTKVNWTVGPKKAEASWHSALDRSSDTWTTSIAGTVVVCPRILPEVRYPPVSTRHLRQGLPVFSTICLPHMIRSEAFRGPEQGGYAG